MISSLKAEFMADPLGFTGYLAHARLMTGSGLSFEEWICSDHSRPIVSERGGSSSRVSLSERGILGGEVPGQSH